VPVEFSADQTEQLRGMLDQQAKTLRVVDKRMTRIEAHEVGSPPFTGAGGPGIADFLYEDGIVTDPAVAREDVPCLCNEIESRGGHSELCFKHGVVGALSKDQIDLYCATKEVRPLSPDQKARLEDFNSAAATCHTAIQGVPKGQELEPWMSCMSAELRARGRELSGVETVDRANSDTPITSSTPSATGAVMPSATPGPAEEGVDTHSSTTTYAEDDPQAGEISDEGFGSAHPGLTKYVQSLNEG